MAVPTAPDLWKTAIDSVDLQVKDRLAPTKTLVRDIVYEVLKEAKARHSDSVKKCLRLPNGIIVRDVMEKIMHWVNCFEEVGDNAVQFDSGHALYRGLLYDSFYKLWSIPARSSEKS
jgi:hypothetical protein